MFPPMPSEAAAVRVTRSFQASLARIAARSGRLTAAEWAALGSWNEADIARFLTRVDPVWSAARAATVNASAGYYAVITDTPALIVDPASLGFPVDPRAPFTAYWHGLAEGRDWVDALAAGEARALSTGVDLVAGTSRRTASLVAGTGVVGWRRVTTGNSCRWCATISTQRYKSAESADFGHDNCDCIVTPIYGDRDPGQVINEARRQDLAQTVPAVRV